MLRNLRNDQQKTGHPLMDTLPDLADTLCYLPVSGELWRKRHQLRGEPGRTKLFTDGTSYAYGLTEDLRPCVGFACPKSSTVELVDTFIRREHCNKILPRQPRNYSSCRVQRWAGRQKELKVAKCVLSSLTLHLTSVYLTRPIKKALHISLLRKILREFVVILLH